MKRVNRFKKVFLFSLLFLGLGLFLAEQLQAKSIAKAKPNSSPKGAKQESRGGIPAGALPLAQGLTQNSAQAYSASPEFAPGEFIVKLKQGRSLADIKNLNAQCGIGRVARVFPDPKEKLAKLKDRLAKLNAGHASWFWQLDKNSQEYKDYLARVNQEKSQLQSQIKEQEGIISEAQKRPKGADGAGLENIYLLKTSDKSDILSLVKKYKDNPAIAYAEPNYIVSVNLDSGHDSWYWQLDKGSKAVQEYAAKIARDKDKAKAIEAILLKEKAISANRASQGLAQDTTLSPPDGLGRILSPLPAPIPLLQKDALSDDVISEHISLPNDPYYSRINSWGQGYRDLWGLERIQAAQAWTAFTKNGRPGYEFAGEGVIVAVVDTGVDYNHEDIKNNMWKDASGNYGFDFANSVDNNGDGDYDDPGLDINGDGDYSDAGEVLPDVKDTDPLDDYGHGTHVAGTIAAEGNNNIGIIGVAPKAKIMAVKALANNGRGGVVNLARAITYAADHEANIINNSWGACINPAPSVLVDAVNHALAKNCAVLASSGNSSANVAYYTPANVPGVISVGSIDHQGRRSYYSNYGFATDITAPGGSCDWEIVANSSCSGGFYAYSTGEKRPQIYLEYSKMDTDNSITLYLNKGPGGGEVRYARYRILEEGDPELLGSGTLDTFSSTPEYHVPYIVDITGPADDEVLIFSFVEETQDKQFSFDSLQIFGYTYEEKHIAGQLINRNFTGRDILSLRAQGTDMYKDGAGIVNEKYYRSLGTSMSCPHASGVAALVKAARPGFSWQDVAGALMASADDIMAAGRDIETGFGCINANKALIQQPKPLIKLGLAADQNLFKALVETEGNGDGYLNPGETGQAAASISNLWSAADTAQAVITCSNPSVRIVEPTVNFTNLLLRETKAFTIPITIDSAAQGLSEIWFDFQLSASGGFQGQERHFAGFVIPAMVNPFPLANGWPVPVSYPPEQTYRMADAPIVADLDGDHKSEIVVSERTQLKVYCFDGTLKPGWPKEIGEDIMSWQSAGDLDGDRDLEIVFVAPDRVTDNEGHEVKVYVLHHDGSALSGWPKTLGLNDTQIIGRSVPVLADVNNDTKMEIIFLFERQIAEKTFQAEVHVWKADGSELPGWPKEIPVASEKSWNRGIIVSPAVGDLNGDGKLEIIVPIADQNFIGSGDERRLLDKLYVWQGDGAVLAGWPLEFAGRQIQALAVGDLDADQKDEAVLNLFAESNFKSVISVFQGNGTIMPGWPTPEIDGYSFSYAQSGFALGDIDNDNKLEIVANMFSRTNAGWGIVYAWGYDGKIVSGWPQSYAPNLWGFWGSSMPVISDIDADGQNEVILSTGESSSAFIRGYYDSRLFAWHGNGSAVASFPKESMAWVLFNPSLGDMDGDGRAELLMTSAMEDEVNNVNWAGQLFALTFPGRADSIEWGTLGCNAQRTSRHVRNNELSGLITNRGGQAVAGVAINLSPAGRLALSGTSGVYSMRNLANGTYTITPSKYGHTFVPSSRTITVNNANISGLDFSGNPNHTPTLTPIGSKSIVVGQALTFTVTALDVDGDTLTYSAIGLPAGATFPAATHTFSWTPLETQAGDHRVVFGVSDGKETAEEAIIITVTRSAPPTNHPPVLASIGNQAVAEGSALTFTISATDPDAGDSLTYSATGLPTGANFDPVTRIFNWTPGYDQAGSYNLTFAVSDGQLTDDENITITVTNTNRSPVLNEIGHKSVAGGSNLSFTVIASDPDGDNTLTYSAAGLPTGATFNETTHVFNWTPSVSQRGDYFVTFSVSDGQITERETITITVTGTNHEPVLNSIGNKLITEGEKLEFIVTATDPDGDTLTYTAINLPYNANINPGSGLFSWTPEHSQIGDHTITFRVSDGQLMDDEVVLITVTANQPNHSPVLTPIGNKSIAAGSLLNFTVTASDADGDNLTYSATGLPSGATFPAATHTFSWTPLETQAGNHRVVFGVSDGKESAEEAIIITVSTSAPVNRPPALNHIGAKELVEGNNLNFTVTASDPDGDTLTYSATGLPSGATFNTTTHIFNWTPSVGQAGNYPVTFAVSDGRGGSASETFTITVSAKPSSGIPAAPANLRTSVLSSTEIRLNWEDKSTDETGFKIERSLTGQEGTFTQIGTRPANSITCRNFNLTPDTTYYYRVRAYNANGDSLPSNVASAKTSAPPSPPAAPANLRTSVLSSTEIRLNWEDKSTDETGFKIERSLTGQEGTFTQIGTMPANSITCRNFNLTPDTTYYYRVRAYNANGDSAYTNVASAKTAALSSPPVAPTNLRTSVLSSTEIRLNWEDKSTDETGFKIERSSSEVGPFIQIGTMPANSITCRNFNLTPDTTYYYRVRAYSANGDSLPSNVASAKTAALPVAPTNLRTNVLSSTEIRLNWEDKSTDETGFKIERSSSEVGPFIQIGTMPANSITCRNFNLTPNTTYYYRVRAYNANGDSLPSNVASGKTAG